MEITSLNNALVKQWAKYTEKKYREQDQCFLIEGEHLVQEARKAGIIAELMVEKGHPTPYNDYPTYIVNKEILKKISTSVSGTWIVARCHYPSYHKEEIGTHTILLDDVQDPGNVGTIIRTALSFGFDSVVLSNTSVDIYNEKVLRSTQGALFHLPVIKGDLRKIIPMLKGNGVPIIATTLQQATPMSQFPLTDKVALIYGNEGRGISKEILVMADSKMYIEMHTFESLNVAIAAGISMYYFRKAKRN